MDLIVDKRIYALLTLTDRSTNYLIIEKFKHEKEAIGVTKAIWFTLLPYKGKGLRPNSAIALFLQYLYCKHCNAPIFLCTFAASARAITFRPQARRSCRTLY